MTGSFHEVRFPTGISRGASGGPQRRTDIVTLGSGREERNTRWADSRRKYEAGYGIRSLNDLHEVISFYEQRRGRLYGFRWKDPTDFKSCPPQSASDPSDQFIGEGDGVATVFQLQKSYGSGACAYHRTITKPVADSVQVALNGIVASDVTIDNTTGEISFTTPPASGVIITAGFDFDVPVRFDFDELEVSLDAFTAGQIPNITLIEVRL